MREQSATRSSENKWFHVPQRARKKRTPESAEVTCMACAPHHVALEFQCCYVRQGRLIVSIQDKATHFVEVETRALTDSSGCTTAPDHVWAGGNDEWPWPSPCCVDPDEPGSLAEVSSTREGRGRSPERASQTSCDECLLRGVISSDRSYSRMP